MSPGDPRLSQRAARYRGGRDEALEAIILHPGTADDGGAAHAGTGLPSEEFIGCVTVL